MQDFSLAPAQGHDVPDGVIRLNYRSSLDATADWALFQPGTRRDLWFIVIHGHGSRGDQLYTRLDIRQSWLPAFRATGGCILTPNLRGNAWMSPAAAHDLRELLGLLRAEQGLRRTVFCSGSMGGTSNLVYAVLHPEDVQAVIARGAATDIASYTKWCRGQDKPILQQIAAAIESAYGGTPDATPAPYALHSTLGHADRLTMPVFLAHGGADATIPVEQARALAARLRQSPAFRYREIPGGGHDSPLPETESLAWVMRELD